MSICFSIAAGTLSDAESNVWTDVSTNAVLMFTCACSTHVLQAASPGHRNPIGINQGCEQKSENMLDRSRKDWYKDTRKINQSVDTVVVIVHRP
jgi:hypothetical protein